MRTFRICTIGCGGIATGRHGPSYARYAAEHPDDVELAACCDLDEAKAAAFRERFGFTRHYTDLDAMLAAERPDAVCLVAPVGLTCELACRVLEQGYPLLTEKPPGRTTEETDRIVAAAAASGAANQVAFNRRYAPHVVRLKGLIAEGPGTAGIHHVSYVVTRVNRRDPDFSTTAIHGVDAARFLAGSDYAEVRFRYRELPEIGEGVCNIFLDCAFESGATGRLEFCPVAGAVTERAVVHAEGHSYFLRLPQGAGTDEQGSLRHVKGGEVALDDTGRGIEQFVAEGFYGENASFFDDLRAGRRPVGDVASGRLSVEIAECIRERRAEWVQA